jgi:hypothetical protein
MWSKFHRARASDLEDLDIDLAKELWGAAEQASTDYGQSVAFGKGKLPTVQQYAVGILWGNAYRAGTSSPGVTRGIGQGVGGGAGALIGTRVCVPICGGLGTAVGSGVGANLADLADDPRRSEPAFALTTSLAFVHGQIPLATWEP